FSIATTDFTASATRKYATADTSTLTLSLVMMPCDWIGMVTIRRLTRCRTSTNGMMTVRPGSRTPTTRPNRNSTPRSYCLTTRTARANSRINNTITAIAIHTYGMRRPRSVGGVLGRRTVGHRGPEQHRHPTPVHPGRDGAPCRPVTADCGWTPPSGFAVDGPQWTFMGRGPCHHRRLPGHVERSARGRG